MILWLPELRLGRLSRVVLDGTPAPHLDFGEDAALARTTMFSDRKRARPSAPDRRFHLGILKYQVERDRDRGIEVA